MANYTVSTLDDELFNGGNLAAEAADGGGLSLREALELAQGNGAAVADVITFQVSLAGGTLTLTQGHLTIAGSVTIDGDVNGDDSADITIDGDASQVFAITA